MSFSLQFLECASSLSSCFAQSLHGGALQFSIGSKLTLPSCHDSLTKPLIPMFCYLLSN